MLAVSSVHFRICGAKRENVTGGLRKLHNGVVILHTLQLLLLLLSSSSSSSNGRG
jgi:hypothetical protein